MDNFKLRLRFAKTGMAKYISHLDLMATLQRALIRAGVKLKYTQGFNPHPSISIALPLSVGQSSFCELVDFKTEHYLLPDGLPKIVNDLLPDGIEVLDAYTPLKKFDKISWIKVNGELYYDKAPSGVAGDLTSRFAKESIIVEKKSKRGIKEIDIAPHIRDVCYTDGESVTMSALLSAQEPSINPQNLMSALGGEYETLAPDAAFFTRIELYDAQMNVFR
jgi:radical SAM-linked protein